MNRKLNKKGFTLIEVVLVLAIGGLIFLLAFLAFQQVQRNRRDTQRRSDAARIVSEIANFSGDHNGAIPIPGAAALTSPTTFGTFLMVHTGWTNSDSTSKFLDPSGKTYIYDTSASANGSINGPVSSIQYNVGQTCDNNSAGTRDYKIQIKLESGIVCRDNGGQ